MNYQSLFTGVMGTCSNAVVSQQFNKTLLIGWAVRNCVPAMFLPAPIALLKPLLLCWLWAWSTFSELVHLHVWLNFICIWGVGRKKCTAISLVSIADLEHSYFWGRWLRGMHVLLLKILGFVKLLTFIKAPGISVYNCFICLFVFEYRKVFWYSV